MFQRPIARAVSVTAKNIAQSGSGVAKTAVTGRSCAVNCGRGSNISIVREFEP